MSYRDSNNYRVAHEVFIAAGTNYPVEEFTAALEQHLERSPDAAMALTNLVRFIEAAVSKVSLFNDLLHYPVQMEVLMKLFGFSQYFSDILVRDTELFRWLTVADSLVRPRTKEALTQEVQRTLGLFQKPERKLDALKRFYRRELLRVGARDVLGEAGLLAVTREISNLADVLIDACCTIAGQQLGGRFPTAPATPFGMIGLGKLGGAELNYSSDIDIIFIYKDEGELKDTDGRTVTYHEYFNKFVEKAVQNLSQSSAEGYMYRVDLRLRPESGMGPLARSLSSYLLYYESRGELWERQMLVKARPVAGDVGFGQAFLRHLEPFIYPRTFFESPGKAIVRMKAKIEAEIADGGNIKLRAGGIRDIEFIAQALQLVNGGRTKTVRDGNTLRALERLGEARMLSTEEATSLHDAYVLYRTVEHRLQMMLNTQTHSLPEDGNEQTRLALRSGFSSREALFDTLARHRGSVRRIFESVLASDSGGESAGIVGAIDGVLTEKAVDELLRELGFKDLRRSAKYLSILVTGRGSAGAVELDNRARGSFRAVAESFFRDLATTPSPDMTLRNFVTLAGAQKFPEQFYAGLGQPNFRHLLLSICAASPRLAKGLANHPSLLESLLGDREAFGGRPGLFPLTSENLHHFKNQEELRSATKYLLGVVSFDELTHDLSQTADAVLTTVLAEQGRKQRLKSAPLALLAMGKYGTRELTFDADLDILFIAGTLPQSRLLKVEALARGVLNRLTEFTTGGRLYDADVRLRPEGRNAPLVIDRESYARYLERRASLWERQSLTRLRFVCGDEALGGEVVADVEKFVYASPLLPAWVDDIVTMRKKMETRSRTAQSDFLDIKLGAGGMVDVEFLAQMLQLKHAHAHKVLRGKATTEVLHAAAEAHLLDGGQSAEMAAAYRFYRKLESYSRLTLEERRTILPEGEKLDLLAKVVEGIDGERLNARVRATMTEVRSVFLETIATLRQ